MPQAKRVHHVTVVVTDLEKAAAFYGGLLGLPRLPRPQTNPGLFFQAGDIQLHITLASSPITLSPWSIPDLLSVGYSSPHTARHFLPCQNCSSIGSWICSR